MSNQYSFSLMTKQRKDAEKMLAPEMSLHYYETCNGPLCREAVSKNGKKMVRRRRLMKRMP